MLPAQEALQRLQEGNQRFVSNTISLDTLASRNLRSELVAEQEPFAVILGCSDSRAPVELIFDQGLGDLFVIRVAGNVVAPSQVGSVEFAAVHFGTRLVVVLGHTNCGAIAATLQHLQSDHTQDQSQPSQNLLSIVERIEPTVKSLLSTNLAQDKEALAREAVRANVRRSVDHLQHGSNILEDLIHNHGLLVVGAEYSLESGEVDFFDGLS